MHRRLQAAAGPPSAIDMCCCAQRHSNSHGLPPQAAPGRKSPQDQTHRRLLARTPNKHQASAHLCCVQRHCDALGPTAHQQKPCPNTNPPRTEPTFAASSAIVMRLGQSSALASPPFCRAVFSRSYSEPRKQYSAMQCCVWANGDSQATHLACGQEARGAMPAMHCIEQQCLTSQLRGDGRAIQRVAATSAPTRPSNPAQAGMQAVWRGAAANALPCTLTLWQNQAGSGHLAVLMLEH